MGGTVVKRGKGWTARYRYADPSGLKREISKAFPTIEEAKAELARLEYFHRSGREINPEQLTVKEYAQRWLEAKKADGASEATLVHYGKSLDHVLPLIGRMRLRDVKPIHAREVNTALLSKMSATSARGYRIDVNVLFNQAVRDELLERNPFKAVPLPKASRREVPFLEDPERQRLLEAAGSHDHGEIVRLALLTGLRLGELQRLTWPDVDFDRRVLRIRQAKTAAGVRNVSIGPDTVEMLQLVRSRQREWQVAAYAWEDSQAVFTNRGGGALSTRAIGQFWESRRWLPSSPFPRPPSYPRQLAH